MRTASRASNQPSIARGRRADRVTPMPPEPFALGIAFRTRSGDEFARVPVPGRTGDRGSGRPAHANVGPGVTGAEYPRDTEHTGRRPSRTLRRRRHPDLNGCARPRQRVVKPAPVWHPRRLRAPQTNGQKTRAKRSVARGVGTPTVLSTASGGRSASPTDGNGSRRSPTHSRS